MTAEIVTIQLDQIEGIEERTAVVPARPDVIEAHHALAVTHHRLPIDDAGSRAQPSHGFDNQREAVRQVIAGAAVEPHLGAVLAGDDPEAVVLDFMQPQLARRRLMGFGRKAGRNKTNRKGTLVQHGALMARYMEKDYLILKRASASRTSGKWSEDDFDVLTDGVVVGRIFHANA